MWVESPFNRSLQTCPLPESHLPKVNSFCPPDEQAFILAEPDTAVYAPGAFVLALAALKAEDRVTEAFRTGTGMGWHEHDDGVFVG